MATRNLLIPLACKSGPNASAIQPTPPSSSSWAPPPSPSAGPTNWWKHWSAATARAFATTADALAVLDGHQIDAAHIAGASLGGGIAQLLAVHHPARVLTLNALMTSPMSHSFFSPGLPTQIAPLILPHTATASLLG